MISIIIETAIALTIIVVSSLTISGIIYNNSLVNTKALNQNNAIYDIFMALLKNATYNSCILNSNATCINNFLGMFCNFYGLPYASLSYNSSNFEYGNASSCTYKNRFCLPMKKGSEYSISCITVCD